MNGGAAFEQGALSVLTWLATERFPVATLPGHLGFMHKFLPQPTAAAGPLDQNYQDRNLIMPPLMVHGMGENGKKTLANLQQINVWSSYLHSFYGLANLASPCYEQTADPIPTELVLGPGIRAIYDQHYLTKGGCGRVQQAALEH